MRDRKEGYDWLDDPFDEKKQQPVARGGCSTKLVVAGLAAVILVCVFFVVSCVSMTTVIGSYAG